ncbi:DUF4345 domain-containing protein [Vibrio agarivorans]|uniref:DUF4345 domain-containing protein n=1 Tax=Vibrio agarivorans TaxID=153622 RepID=A0ABT7Y687_9VIBR|nr:DUF4345 domain-containing protein [Vibrio agarivorans]MDN2483496.1 DUF4345 domain-containing protein [Vibrio agarivorans]
MAKVIIYATALFFLSYGTAFIFVPSEMANIITGAAPAGSSATIDFRATYGGAQFAIGLALLVIMKYRRDIDLALIIVALALFSMAFGRLLGIAIDGEPNTLMWMYLVLELSFGALALWLRTYE